MIVNCKNCDAELVRRPCRTKGNNYCNAKCQMAYEYSVGIRDKSTIALKAHEANRNAPYKPRPDMRGDNNPSKRKEVREKIRLSKLGKKNPMFGKFGKKHHNYKTGASMERGKRWGRSIYQNWRRKVFERDSYTCQMCEDKRGNNLNAHHLDSWAEFPERRYDVDNGQTLCEECHTLVHRMLSKLKLVA